LASSPSRPSNTRQLGFYIALLVIASFLSFHLEAPEIGHPTLSVFLAVVAALLVYPLVWYLLHRFVLHGQFLYRSPITAGLRKGIHYDHHQDPNDLRVLFGALQTALPTIGAVTLPLGSLIGGSAGAAAAVAAAIGRHCFMSIATVSGTYATHRGTRSFSASSHCTCFTIFTTKMATSASRISFGTGWVALTTPGPVRFPGV